MFESLISDRMKGVKLNIIREITKKTVQPGFISFAGGNPAPETFPAAELGEIADRAIVNNKIAALQYGTTIGYSPLREWIAARLVKNGIAVTPEHIILTTGSQQGIDLAARTFLNPGDGVIMENPTYVAALQIMRLYGAEIGAVPLTQQGLSLERIEALAATGKYKLFYSVPTYQNPTGFVMPEEIRRELPRILEKYDMLMLEDDPYGELCYEGEPLRPVKSYGGERVIYLGTFSKTVAPGLRVGFVAAAPELIAKFEVAKQSADIHSSSLAQVLLLEYLTVHDLDAHITQTVELYRSKRDHMLSLAAKHFPASVKVYPPAGGLFIWAELPEDRDASELLQLALEQKVAFIPATTFHPDGGGKNTMRLSFSNPTAAQTEQGIATLGKLMREMGL